MVDCEVLFLDAKDAAERNVVEGWYWTPYLDGPLHGPFSTEEAAEKDLLDNA